MTVEQNIERIHQNAVDHGWWDEPRSMEEAAALIHSELSEALEEYRAGRELVWYGEGGKPEGIAIELIDAVIRIYDLIGAIGLTPTSVRLSKSMKNTIDTINFPEFIYRCHSAITTAFDDRLEVGFKDFIWMPVFMIFYWVRKQNLDPEELIEIKHNYNIARPYKHGKRC